MGRLCLFVLLSQTTTFRAPALARNDDADDTFDSDEEVCEATRRRL